MNSEEKIIAALKQSEDGRDDAETLHGVLGDMTRNQSFYLRVFPWLIMFATLAVAVVSAIKFFHAGQTMEWILYATLFLTALIIMSIIKIWFYLCWVRNSIMREIKRVELRLLVARDARTGSH
jgi:ABC-type transport system involved in cytochrome bd biosynthesis fused ATPase/permease subunit